ncbi:MAG: type IX secretion system protein PorQ [Bacteroidales bacterium]|nr:type IX secretion system protein PorQ [Bacteroidales bacterium]
MKKSIVFIAVFLLIVFITGNISAQVGGKGTYQFLNLPNSARIAALGSNFLAINDDDITLTLANPSLINENMHNQLGFSFVDYYTDVNYGFAQYSRTFDKVGSFVGTMQYIDYGQFQEADEAGVQYGYFHAGEYALNIGWGRKLTPLFAVGSNLKLVYSSLESYNSFGIGVDIAGSYFSKDELFDASIIFRNIGYQVVAYHSGDHEPFPFEIQAGLSKELKHIPFRFSALLTHLEKWNLRYDNPINPSGGIDPVTGEPNEISGIDEFADNLMRHIVLGGEVTIAKVLSLRGAYNYQRRQEMKVPDKTAMVGFSWGLGLRIKQFQFSYARAAYHVVGSPNFITLMVDMDGFAKNQ